MKINEIAIEKLFHHPDNPRSSYTDIEELKKSIKEQGILQPLTVVKISTGYNVVAGNRRLEAAMAAGLKTCPCIIQEMDEKTQAAVILVENMQRKNLNPYEECKGIQLCLDLGMDEKEISQKTGFSKETIRHRKKLAELDQDKLKEKCCDGQISMQDLIKLEQIKDPESRNDVLNSIGTNNFNVDFQNAISAQERKKKMTAIRLKLETFAEEMPENWYDSNFEIKQWRVPETFDIPEDSAEREYVFLHVSPGESWESYKLYARRIKEEEDEEEEEEQADSKWQRLNTVRDKFRVINEAFRNTRQEFVVSHATAMTTESILMWCGFIFLSEEFDYVGPDEKQYDLPHPFKPASDMYYTSLRRFEELTGAEFDKAFNQRSSREFYAAMTILIYTALEEHIQNIHADYNGVYKKDDPDTELAYKFLEELGYVTSDAEEEMLNGTHNYYDEANKVQEEF